MTKIITIDGFDKAIMGRSCIWERTGHREDRVVYSGEKIVEILVERDGMTSDEALEYIEFNIEGAYVGEQTPAVLWRDLDEEEFQ
jgi:hypothetical protein|tara:strand:- start:1246 stop:1500 length:255 start_codon:yes stop_codon:yes gene_type:complete